MKLILWIIFIALLAVTGYQNYLIGASGYDVFSLEFAGKTHGLVIMGNWLNCFYGDSNLLEVARQNTHWDFFFIASYVTLLITLSNWQMQRENWLPLNELLRFNFLLVVAAGGLDVVENFRLLHNFHHVNDAASYWGTCWLTGLKFIFIAVAVLIFMISFIKSLIIKWAF
ncbi:hypothetical protein [Mucilaginibacter sp. AK015]|uniref:hypothetical protein n=1 Tax=Mucilaginibacter sp. AK015 TaxID=2723072 RepID=UPI00161438FC|nr:hypothetical protein [Mucilaginibacter sp. AK015]MBB5394146.1 hypothetical protein [Mucilaginibacter sp. AK015]